MIRIIKKIIYISKLRYYRFRNNSYKIIHLNYKYRHNRNLDIKNPKTLNEKIQWLKFNWFDEKAIIAADKFQVRDFIKDKGLDDILIPMLGIYEKAEDVDFSKLPKEFIIKHCLDSGGVVRVRENTYKQDVDKARKMIFKKRKQNYSKYNGEWVYNNDNNSFIVEKLLKNTKSGINDYKFFCFHGEPKFLFVATDRESKPKFTFFDLEWNRIPVKNHYEIDTREIPKPEKLTEMIEICKILSSDFPHVRVDLYFEEDKVYFGELTFFHFSGQEPFELYQYDYEFGKYLDLNKIHKNQVKQNKV